MYYCLQWSQIILSLLATILGALQGGFLGIAITIISGLSSAIMIIKSSYKCYENWRRYRSALKKIKSLTRRYLTDNEPFKVEQTDDNIRLYVLLLDMLIVEKTNEWKIMQKQDEATNE